MNIFMYLRAEDGVALRDFLKKNPSVKGIEKEKEFLDAGLIARVCYSLEVELNKLKSGSLMTYCKARSESLGKL